MSTPHLSVASAIEKNKIASATAFVLLLSIVVTDLNGAYVETLYLARNSENVVWNGFTYIASNFETKLDLGSESLPKFVVTSTDPSGYIRSRMEAYSGGVGFAVTLSVVNTGNLTQPPEIQETFEVTEASASGYEISFTMGVENPISQRFPVNLQMRDQCPYTFKGPRCKYVGSTTTCDFTYHGSNGCKSKANQVNFGGFPGLQTLNV